LQQVSLVGSEFDVRGLGCETAASYLTVEFGQRTRVAGTLDHEEHPDLVGRSRERRSLDSTLEQYQVGGGGVLGPGCQPAPVDRAAVSDEALLTRIHDAVHTVHHQDLL